MPTNNIQQSFGRFLKFWRNLHQLNQEELAFRVGSSPRHISRLENGKSRPSESIIKEISAVLKLGERDSNHLLISADYAPDIKKVDFNSPELKWLRKAMNLNLKALDPHPSVLIDATANILMANKAWVAFYTEESNSEHINTVTNLYDLLFSRVNSTALANGWDNTLSVILMSLQQQALFSDDENDYAISRRLASYENVPKNWQQKAINFEPMASFRLQMDVNGKSERFFSVNSTVGALGPNSYASEPRLTINTLFPEDDSLDLSHLLKKDLSHPLLFY